MRWNLFCSAFKILCLYNSMVEKIFSLFFLVGNKLERLEQSWEQMEGREGARAKLFVCKKAEELRSFHVTGEIRKQQERPFFFFLPLTFSSLIYTPWENKMKKEMKLKKQTYTIPSNYKKFKCTQKVYQMEVFVCMLFINVIFPEGFLHYVMAPCIIK